LDIKYYYADEAYVRHPMGETGIQPWEDDIPIQSELNLSERRSDSVQ